MSVYAVIHTGGKQYRVSPGDRVTVEKLPAQPGEQIELDRVYLLAHDGRIIVGDPIVKNTRVRAQVVGQKRDRKLIIFKHRRRKGYRNTTGHRQDVTDLRIIEIVHDGVSYREPLKKADAGDAKATAPGKPAHAKQQAAPEQKPVKAAKASITGAAPALLQPEKPKPVEQNAAPGSAALTEAAPKEPVVFSAIPAEPLAPTSVAKPIVAERSVAPEAALLKEPAQPMTNAAQIADELPVSAEAAKLPAPGTSQDERKRRNVIGAVIIVLALLGLLFFLRRERPAITSAPPPEMSKTAEPVKAKPPVREVKTRETAPVDKPAAPAQPPD